MNKIVFIQPLRYEQDAKWVQFVLAEFCSFEFRVFILFDWLPYLG